jgi:hypothetical protein
VRINQENGSKGLLGVIVKAPYHVFGLIIGYVKFLGRHNGDTNNDGDWGVERCIDDDAYKVAFKKFSSLYLKINHQMFYTNVASSMIYWVLFLTLSYAFAYTSVWFLLWIGFNGWLIYSIVEKISENPERSGHPAIEGYQNFKNKITAYLEYVTVDRLTESVNAILEAKK